MVNYPVILLTLTAKMLEQDRLLCIYYRKLRNYLFAIIEPRTRIRYASPAKCMVNTYLNLFNIF